MYIEVLIDNNGKTEIIKFSSYDWQKKGAKKTLIGKRGLFSVREVRIDKEGNQRIEYWEYEGVKNLIRGKPRCQAC